MTTEGVVAGWHDDIYDSQAVAMQLALQIAVMGEPVSRLRHPRGRPCDARFISNAELKLQANK